MLLALTVVGAGLSLVTVQASERRILQNIASSEQATVLGRAGAEWMMRNVEQDSAWRAALTSGTALSVDPATGLAFSVMLTDSDGDLADNDTDSVTLTATGTYGGATHTMSLSASPKPHSALRYTLVAGDDIDLGVATVGGPVYATDQIRSDDTDNVTTLDGASFEVPAGGSIEDGLSPATEGVESVSIPSPQLAFYIAKATTISLDQNDRLDNTNLTPTTNSQGTANGQGIYYLHVGWEDVQIRHTHLKGTLIIKGYGWNTIIFDRPCWLEQGPDGYPTLLIDVPNGHVDFRFPTAQLDEDARGVDYNEDGDQDDSFTSSLNGLVWVNASSVDLYNSAWTFQGCLVATKDVLVEDGVTIQNDPSLGSQMIPGFTDGVLHVLRGSIREGAP